MVHSYDPLRDLRATKIVNRKVGAALILVLEPTEALGLACFLVARKFQKGWIAKLGEDCDYIAFGEFEREATEVDVGRVAVVDVPGRLWGTACC